MFECTEVRLKNIVAIAGVNMGPQWLGRIGLGIADDALTIVETSLKAGLDPAQN
jgi:hypothetical protein